MNNLVVVAFFFIVVFFLSEQGYCNHNLGLAKVQAKREARESHLMLPRVRKSVKEWTFTLPIELSSWELESQMDSWIFREQL
jgi:hypothetical protein